MNHASATQDAAVKVLWDADDWLKRRKEGWRLVKVRIDQLYYRKRPSPEPQNISDTAWFYDAHDGIAVFTEHKDKDGVSATTSFVIPWALLQASLRRNRKD